MRLDGVLGTDASLLADLELLVGLVVLTQMVLGLRLAWLGRIEAHVRSMKLLTGMIGLFLLLFLGNVLLGGDVEAVHAGARNPGFLALLLLHVLASLLAGLGTVLTLRWGFRLADARRSGGGQGADLRLRKRHGRWGGVLTGFWLANGAMGILIYLIAYVL